MFNNKYKIENDTKQNYYYKQENNDQNLNVIDKNKDINENEDLPLSSKIQEKKTEVKVKISMMKRNIIEFKREIDKSSENYRDLNAKYQAAREIEELRNYQRNNLFDEVKSIQFKNDSIQASIHSLITEEEELKKDLNFLNSKKDEFMSENKNMINYNEELKTQRQLLEKEVKILRERFNNNEKLKIDNEIINTTSEKQYEHINKELSENNRKISILQNKIDDLISKIKKGEELLALENYDSTSHSEFNQTLERRILTLKETLKLNENKLIMIKREVDNLKFYIDEGEGERILLNKKLEDLINILTNINSTNSKINTFLNFLIDSIGKKTRFMINESNNLEKSTEMKNKILNFLKDINSYQDIVENY